ncbi:peptidoglycan recognition protein-like [Aricia agestis]|uniref:peptidoglycan recognition protein-like n=1 Tax=Aricia agestis TaxID=91739 RepID=UPI001C2085B8|nr:peptidoglycan recognition protein-like [Aricia agestis]
MKYYLLFTIAVLKTVFANECGVTPIEVWGGSSSKRTEWLPSPVNLVVIQHTVTTECITDEECVRSLRAIRAHQQSTGFIDIAISFLIGGNGKVYEGSGWREGAHTAGYNNRSVAISFMGDFRYKRPTPEAIRAAQELIVCGMHKKRLGFSYKLVGHQQLVPTLSPGAELQRVIETWPHWVSDIRGL